MAQESEDGGDTDLDLLSGKTAPQFAQRDVRLLRNPVLQPFCIGVQRISLVSAKLCCSQVSLGTPELKEAPDRTEAYPMQFCRFFSCAPGLNRVNHRQSQIYRIGLLC